MKAWYGNAATADNDWAYDWLPKLDKQLRHPAGLREDVSGPDQRLHLPGLQSAGGISEQGKITAGAVEAEVSGHHRSAGTETSRVLAKLRRASTTSIRPKSRPKCSACRPPALRKRTGRWSISARWLQWHWKGAEPPGRGAAGHRDHGAICSTLRELYQKEGGAFPDPILNLTWHYTNADEPDAGRTGQGDQRQGAGRRQRSEGSERASVLRKAGEQLDGFAQLRDDGSTACGCWMFSGARPKRATDGPARQRRSQRARARTRTGPGPGRRTGESCTTAPRADPAGNPGIRSAS